MTACHSILSTRMSLTLEWSQTDDLQSTDCPRDAEEIALIIEGLSSHPLSRRTTPP